MRARWILEDPSPETAIAQTTIARWWPGIYYYVGTVKIELHPEDWQLINSLQTGVDDPTPGADVFVTQAFRCNYLGIPRSFYSPLFQKKTASIEEANRLHKTVVKLLAGGKRMRLMKLQPELIH
jgi:hypothetical protein